MKKILFLFMACIFFMQNTFSQENKETIDARMQWWREARFGMFVHWGLYSIPAGEWNGKEFLELVNGL